LIAWLVGKLVGCFVGGSFIEWVCECAVSYLVDWLGGLLVGYLVIWLVILLVI
jgi:hypothetical protein